MDPMSALRQETAPAARELDLVLAARERGGHFRDELVDAYLPLIRRAARAYRGASVDRIELMQEGVVGLLRALERFDETLGTPFWAYASWWVRQAMQQLVAELSRPVVLSDRAARELAQVRRAQRRLGQVAGHEPGTAELSAETGLDPAQVERLHAVGSRARALDERLPGEDGPGETLGERLPDPYAEDAYERAGWRLEARALPTLLALLDDRERTVVCRRYGIGGTAETLQEIAETLRLSAERVRQIEHAALGKLHDRAMSGPLSQTLAGPT
jgi:RNA polymerase sigma factor (sigma-70 family)